VAELLDIAAERSGCITFGLRMAESRQLSNFGAMSLLITHQPTVRDAMAAIVSYRHLLNESLAASVEDCGDLVILREELLVETERSLRQAYELAIGTLFRMVRSLLGPRWRPLSVNFTHAAPPDLNVHRRILGLDVQFSSEFNGIVCMSADLDRVNPTADPALAQYAKQFIDTLPFADRKSTTHEVRKTIYLLLPLGGAGIGRVAESLGMNVRTLQRRLAAEGEEFSDLVNGVRRDLIVRYLENKAYSVGRVAEMLGYGQLSSFTRWFVSQFGVSPTAWRRARERAPLER
jgi:AraC-like DNA-binding protein